MHECGHAYSCIHALVDLCLSMFANACVDVGCVSVHGFRVCEYARAAGLREYGCMDALTPPCK